MDGCVLLIAISFMKLPVLLLLGLKERGISVLYPERTFTADHNTPTINQHLPVEDPLSANQLHLEENSKEYGISHWGLGNKKMESFMSWVLKTELHYLALLLFARFILHPRCLWCHCFGIGTSEMVLSTQCNATKTQKDAYSRRW
jgi:3-isopropylmalate/(R)-2-methylmalate dehydratase large subunit